MEAVAVVDAWQEHNENLKPEKHASEVPIAHASPRRQNCSRPYCELRSSALPFPHLTPRRSPRPPPLPKEPMQLLQRWSDLMDPTVTVLVAGDSPSLSSLALYASADNLCTLPLRAEPGNASRRGWGSAIVTDVV